MGYCTSYDMEVRNINEDDLTKINEILASVGIINYALQKGVMTGKSEANFDTYDDVKWYNHEEDLIEVSKQFPNAVFMIHGDAEDYEDHWRKYFQNGKSEFCKGKLIYRDPTTILW